MNPRKNIIWTLIIAVVAIILGCALLKWSSCTEQTASNHQTITK